MNATPTALTRLRGDFPEARMNARKVASIVEAPGCTRRTLLDAAGVDTARLVQELGYRRDRQSPLAISRAAQFDALLARDEHAQLIQLARRYLNLNLTDVRKRDLSASGTSGRVRAAAYSRRRILTKQELRNILRGEAESSNLLIKPVTSITIGELEAHLEQDVLAFAERGLLHVVAVRNFYMLRDHADPALVGQAARETAVHVLSLQRMAQTLGARPEQISTKVLLVLPRDLLFVPTGVVVDVADEVRHLSDALDRISDVEAAAEKLDLVTPLPALPLVGEDTASFKAQALEALGALPRRFGDGCVTCPLFRACRDEEERAGSTARLGSAVTGLCGDTGTVERALALTDGMQTPQTVSEEVLARILGRARSLTERAEAAGAA